MELNEYQNLASRTAKYPDIGAKFVYPILGLTGETGEVAEKIKKIFRDEGGVVSNERKEELKKELGDVLWYLSQLAKDLDLTLEEVAQKNLDKLQKRQNLGMISGSGDNREEVTA